MYDLTKVNEGFEKMKNVRSKIEGGFTTIHAKLKMLRKIYSEVVSKHKKLECTLGVDALFFQSELIDKEYNNLQSLFLFINNRIYCEYYKLFYYIKDYVEANMEKDIIEDVKMDPSFPAYKSLSTSMQYDFGDIIKMQSQIVNTLNTLDKYCNDNVTTNNKEKDLLKMGLHIDTVIHTQDYMNSILKVKLKMFFQYLATFNAHQHKHLTRLLKKTEMIVDIINDDMPLHESSENMDIPPDKNPDVDMSNNKEDVKVKEGAETPESVDKKKNAESNKTENINVKITEKTQPAISHPKNSKSIPTNTVKINKSSEHDNKTTEKKALKKEPEKNIPATSEKEKTGNTSIVKNTLDTSGDVTKLAKSVVNADNVNFTVSN